MPSTADPTAGRALAEALLLRGDRVAARRALLSTLRAGMRRLEPGDPELGWLHHALGVTATAVGDLDEAARCFAAAQAMAEHAGDAALPAAVEGDLGRLAHLRGDLAEAELRMRRALALRTAAVGERHPSVARDRGRLGSILSEAQRHTEAVALLERAVADLTALCGPDDRETAAARTALGAALHRAGRPQPAAEASRSGLAAWERAVGADHPDLAPALLDLSRLADAEGDKETARRLAARAAGLLEGRVIGDHPCLLAARERAAGYGAAASAPDSSRRPVTLSLP